MIQPNLVVDLCARAADEFDDRFIDHLFDLVETTRDNQDEELNYAVIKLIVSERRRLIA